MLYARRNRSARGRPSDPGSGAIFMINVLLHACSNAVSTAGSSFCRLNSLATLASLTVERLHSSARAHCKLPQVSDLLVQAFTVSDLLNDQQTIAAGIVQYGIAHADEFSDVAMHW